MSYSLVPYLVDLNELRSAIGSKDEALLAAVVEEDPERFQDEAEEGEAEIPLGQALRHLVMGEPPVQGSAHQYGYALERLCAHLGQRLDADMWESIGWQVLEATGFEEVLQQTGSPVPLPPLKDFPSIGHLTPENVRKLVERMGSGHLKTATFSGKKPRPSVASWALRMLMSRILPRAPLTDADLRELLDEYESWLREATASNRGLVFFYY